MTAAVKFNKVGQKATEKLKDMAIGELSALFLGVEVDGEEMNTLMRRNT